VTAPDGAEIAVEPAGSGRPLVMVHGAGSGRWSFDLVRPHLEDRFTVWAVDRRGRGDSSDGDQAAPYAIEREFDDVAAVMREAGPDALLFGHSYGALVSAGAAARLEGLERLVLYEAPMGGVLADDAWIARFEAHVEAGERDAAIREFMRDVGGYSEADIDAMAGTPAWAVRIAAAHTVPRELRAEQAFSTADLRLAELAPATLLLIGSESPDWAQRSTEAFAAAIPGVDVHRLDGHGHGATLSGPDLVAAELARFLG
jgi:pimeloyl-ACP methyl ester carboxylesterase